MYFSENQSIIILSYGRWTMTAQELELFLVSEKEKAERVLGFDLCKRYARCLFCSKADGTPCASAHERLAIARETEGMRIPETLLPEPKLPCGESTLPERPLYFEKASDPEQTDAAQAEEGQVAEEREEEPAERQDEMLETVAHILSEFKMDDLSDEREEELKKISEMMEEPKELPSLLLRTQKVEGDVPLLKLKRKVRESD